MACGTTAKLRRKSRVALIVTQNRAIDVHKAHLSMLIFEKVSSIQKTNMLKTSFH